MAQELQFRETETDDLERVQGDNPLPVRADNVRGTARTSAPLAKGNLDSVEAYFDGYGQLHVVLGGSAGAAALPDAAALADGAANPTTTWVASTPMLLASTTYSRQKSMNGISTDANNGVNVAAAGLVGFNGTNYDRLRSKVFVNLLASAGRTTTQTSADISTYNMRGIKVILDMTNVGAGPSVTVSIKGKAQTANLYYTMLAGAAITTVSTNVYTVFPGAPATANVSANDELPGVVQIVVTANNANSGTYSVDYELLP